MKDENQTRNCIFTSLLELLEHTSYPDITIGQIATNAHIGRRTFYRYFKSKDEVMTEISVRLMDEFADTILLNHATDLASITRSYFSFWEAHIDTLLLLKQAKLLYMIEDNLPTLIQQVAFKTKHISDEAMQAMTPEQRMLHQYTLLFRLAGFWKLTILWCSEVPRKSPEQMSELIRKIIPLE